MSLKVIFKLGKTIDKQLEEEYKTKLKKYLPHRLSVLRDVRTSYIRRKELSVNAATPTIGDLCRLPMVKSILLDTPAAVEVSKRHFKPLIKSFDSTISQWCQNVDNQLLEMMHQSYASYPDLVPETALNLATTFFSCSNHKEYDCCKKFLPYPQVLRHVCAFKEPGDKDEVVEGQARGPEEHVLLHGLGRTEHHWNASQAISFQPKVFQLMTAVVELCGYDPRTTTGKDMDQANPIIECTACNDPGIGRAILTWSTVVRAQQSNYSSLTPPICSSNIS